MAAGGLPSRAASLSDRSGGLPASVTSLGDMADAHLPCTSLGLPMSASRAG
jgi:hypothetical protein